MALGGRSSLVGWYRDALALGTVNSMDEAEKRADRRMRKLEAEVIRLQTELSRMKDQQAKDLHHLDQGLADAQALLNRVLKNVGLRGINFPEKPKRRSR
jgi:hypothetical protein